MQGRKKSGKLAAKATNVSFYKGAYTAGMSQPADIATMELVDPGKVDFDSLDNCLKEIFFVEVSPLRKRFPAARVMARYAWRIMLLARQLAQAIRLPVFDAGDILAISKVKKRDRYHVHMIIPFVEHSPEKLVVQLYQVAVQIMDRLVRNTDKQDRIYPVLDKINTDLITPGLAQVGGGESTIPTLKAAFAMNVPFTCLSRGVYRLGWGCRAILLERSAVSSDSATGARASQNKLTTARWLRNAGLPAPKHIVVSSEEAALKAATKLGWPVVVKPLDRDRGEGVVVDVSNPKALAEAFQQAIKLSKAVLVERQVPGVCHRLFVVKAKKVLFVSKRLPKSVCGDGVRTVAELIEEANGKEVRKAPWLRLKPFPTDELAIECLKRAGLTLESIPDKEQRASLRRIQAVAEGGVAEDLTTEVHPQNVEVALRAAALFHLDSVGVDLITEDISRPWHENGAIINEVNFSSQVGGAARVDGRPSGYLPEFLDMMLGGNGRIPIETYIGSDEGLAAATRRQKTLWEDGIQCFLSSHDKTFQPQGREMVLTDKGLYTRTRQLLANREVEALVLVVMTDEFLHTGLPVDELGLLYFMDNQLQEWDRPGRPISSARYRQLCQLLGAFGKSVT